jgi:hypothetical protein
VVLKRGKQIIFKQSWLGGGDQNLDRRELIRGDIARRLRSICSEYSDEDFNRLVERMTDEQLRGERRATNFPD